MPAKWNIQTDPSTGVTTVILSVRQRKVLASAAELCFQFAYYHAGAEIEQTALKVVDGIAEILKDESTAAGE